MLAPGVKTRSKARHDHTGWILLLCVILALFIFPNCLSARTQGQLTQCKLNLKTLASALEMYSSDNGGRYPARLNQLTRGEAYLDLPTCPADPGVTYAYRIHSQPDCFSIRCEGIHHAQAPRYSTESQPIDHP